MTEPIIRESKQTRSDTTSACDEAVQLETYGVAPSAESQTNAPTRDEPAQLETSDLLIEFNRLHATENDKLVLMRKLLEAVTGMLSDLTQYAMRRGSAKVDADTIVAEYAFRFGRYATEDCSLRAVLAGLRLVKSPPNLAGDVMLVEALKILMDDLLPDDLELMGQIRSKADSTSEPGVSVVRTFDFDGFRFLDRNKSREQGDGASPAPTTLIERYREDYRRALHVIDNDVGGLIRQGKEMRSLMLLMENVSRISAIHESLAKFYTIIFNHIVILERFNSERLRQLGHAPLPICAFFRDSRKSVLEIEREVLNRLRVHGIQTRHWLVKEVVTAEIDYMLDTLQILVEPDFIPLETTNNAEEVDRYVPPAVKLAVWRRDQGKCVQCGSQERLEYDHIIPVSKGGSNTERNIQLLC